MFLDLIIWRHTDKGLEIPPNQFMLMKVMKITVTLVITCLPYLIAQQIRPPK